MPLVGVVGVAAASSSTAELLSAIASSRKPDVDPALDCSWRKLAFQQAPKVLSARIFTDEKAKQLHDALELEKFCGEHFYHPGPQYVQAQPHKQTGISIYVSPMGDDNASGTITKPLGTLPAAVQRVRKLRKGATESSASILLRAGTHRLSAPLVLHHLDSHLLISAYNDEVAVVSGATLLSNLTWTGGAYTGFQPAHLIPLASRVTRPASFAPPRARSQATRGDADGGAGRQPAAHIARAHARAARARSARHARSLSQCKSRARPLPHRLHPIVRKDGMATASVPAV